jgi:predicted ribosomally synthesized peptide with SipW-like signal peptide
MLKIVGLISALLIVIAAAGVGTYAAFNDVQTSSANVFSAGTLDLQLTGTGTPAGDDVTATWGNNTNMVPGGAPISGTVTLKNNGSIAADHVEIKFANTVTTNAAANTAVHIAAGTTTADGTTLTVIDSKLAKTAMISSQHPSGAGSFTTIVDTVNMTSTDNTFYVGKSITDGTSTATITAYNSGTHTVTFAPAFVTTTTTTTVYSVFNHATGFWANGKTVTVGGVTKAITADNDTGTITVGTAFGSAVVKGTLYNIADSDDVNMDKKMIVTSLTYGGTNILGSYTASRPDGQKTLYDLANASTNYTSTTVPTPSGALTKDLVMSVQLDPLAGNGTQGDSVTTTVTFGLFQTAGQSFTAPQ